MSLRQAVTIASLFLFLSTAGLGSAANRISKDTALSKFVKANFQYKDDRYDEAIKLYEEIFNSGLVSGPLYYNLGNSYFQKGALGKAILNYERSRRLMPRDHDLRANYRYALSLVNGRSAEKTLSAFRRLYGQFLDFHSLDEMVLIVFVLGLAIGVSYLLSLYFAWRKSFALRVSVALIFLFLAYLTGFFNTLEAQRNAAIAIADTAAKFEPRQEAPTHFDLPQGNQIKVLKKDGTWAKIKRPDGKEGWVPVADIEKIDQGS